MRVGDPVVGESPTQPPGGRLPTLRSPTRKPPHGRLPTLRLPNRFGVQFQLVRFYYAQRRAGCLAFLSVSATRQTCVVQRRQAPFANGCFVKKIGRKRGFGVLVNRSFFPPPFWLLPFQGESYLGDFSHQN
ncbi:MAG: hypothetical protein LBQ66_09200 [Planctomycetaceae bacterium]|nr:hypothetical protein [Planctomycetaceae bacterium]